MSLTPERTFMITTCILLEQYIDYNYMTEIRTYLNFDYQMSTELSNSLFINIISQKVMFQMPILSDQHTC